MKWNNGIWRVKHSLIKGYLCCFLSFFLTYLVLNFFSRQCFMIHGFLNPSQQCFRAQGVWPVLALLLWVALAAHPVPSLPELLSVPGKSSHFWNTHWEKARIYGESRLPAKGKELRRSVPKQSSGQDLPTFVFPPSWVISSLEYRGVGSHRDCTGERTGAGW